jgi:2'-5' RNA ligase
MPEPAAPPAPAERARVFFALWPDARTAAALHETGAELHAGCGGRRMREASLHLTLAFIGEIPRARVAELLALAGGLAGAPFELVLSRSGSWKGNRVVWLAPRETPPALEALAATLSQALRAAGFALEARRFRAHLTLVRDARRAPPPTTREVHWPVGEFVLVESERRAEGAQYRILGRWPLRGGAAGEGASDSAGRTGPAASEA